MLAVFCCCRLSSLARTVVTGGFSSACPAAVSSDPRLSLPPPPLPHVLAHRGRQAATAGPAGPAGGQDAEGRGQGGLSQRGRRGQGGDAERQGQGAGGHRQEGAGG